MTLTSSTLQIRMHDYLGHLNIIFVGLYALLFYTIKMDVVSLFADLSFLFLVNLYYICCICLQIVFWKNREIVTRFHKRVTILAGSEHVLQGVQLWHNFGKTWHDFQLVRHAFRIRLVVLWVVRTNRVTIWQIVTRFCPDLNTLKAFHDLFVV